MALVSSQDDVEIKVGEMFKYQIDIEGGDHTCIEKFLVDTENENFSKKKCWFKYSKKKLLLQGKPAKEDIGLYKIKIIMDDGEEQSFNVNVTE